MRMGDSEPQPPQSLAELLSELTNRPVGDRRVDRLRARGIAFAERVTSVGPMRPIAEVGWLAARRDASVGGTVLAGALAYRIFIWLLPLALVAVLGARARRRLGRGAARRTCETRG